MIKSWDVFWIDLLIVLYLQITSKKSPLKKSNAPLWRKPLGGIADNRRRTLPRRYLASGGTAAYSNIGVDR